MEYSLRFRSVEKSEMIKARQIYLREEPDAPRMSQRWRMIYIAAQSIRGDQSALNPWRLIRNDFLVINTLILNGSVTPSIDRDRREFLNITSMDERLMLIALHAMAQK